LGPGDVVSIEAGDVVPADGRLLEAATLEVAESALTGESMPVAKGPEAVTDPETPLGDRTDMVYMNTNVTRGAGTLTLNQMTATELTIPGRRCTISGSGFSTREPSSTRTASPTCRWTNSCCPCCSRRTRSSTTASCGRRRPVPAAADVVGQLHDAGVPGRGARLRQAG